MPEKKTKERAARAKRQGKSPSTQAGEYVREEIHHVREGKHGARSTKQAIAIGLSKARRSGVRLPAKGPSASRRSVSSSSKAAARRRKDPQRSRAAKRALKHERRSTASPRALSRQAKGAARRRTKADRSRSARKAARTRKRRGH
jgi:uncharacterized protein DUF6496